MYIIEITCAKCHNKHEKQCKNVQLSDVILILYKMQMDILFGNIYCEKCGIIGMTKLTICDNSNLAVFKKFISPMPPFGTNNPVAAIFGKKDKGTCFLCKGTGYIEISLKGHFYDDLRIISPERCPICGGKGYLKKGKEG